MILRWSYYIKPTVPSQFIKFVSFVKCTIEQFIPPYFNNCRHYLLNYMAFCSAFPIQGLLEPYHRSFFSFNKNRKNMNMGKYFIPNNLKSKQFKVIQYPFIRFFSTGIFDRWLESISNSSLLFLIFNNTILICWLTLYIEPNQ